jgi:hypothetical protein
MNKRSYSAAEWDAMTDAEKAAALRDAPAVNGEKSGEAVLKKMQQAIVTLSVIRLRRKAMDYALPKQRAALVESFIRNFRETAIDKGLPANLQDTIAVVIRSETINWPGFGMKLFRDD